MNLIDDAVLYDYTHNFKPIGKIKDVCFETSSYDLQTSMSFTADLYPDAAKKIINGINCCENTFSLVPSNYNFLFGSYIPAIKKVIFNPPATIVLWKDGTKTVVKCTEEDSFSEWAGLSLCISKKILGDNFHKTFKKWCKDEEPASDKSLEDFRTLKKTMDDLKKLEV